MLTDYVYKDYNNNNLCQGGNVFGLVCMSVCLTVCQQDYLWPDLHSIHLLDRWSKGKGRTHWILCANPNQVRIHKACFIFLSNNNCFLKHEHFVQASPQVRTNIWKHLMFPLMLVALGRVTSQLRKVIIEGAFECTVAIVQFFAHQVLF